MYIFSYFLTINKLLISESLISESPYNNLNADWLLYSQ